MRITPWKSRKELEELKHWLFIEATDDSKRRAMQRIYAYISRGPYLPHIIEYTGRLIQCDMNDKEDLEDGQDVEQLKCQYCMILIRFVNGMLDPVQQAQFAIPLHTLAENIGLPSWFVELRHQSTHERALPSLDMLRICCKQAIKWTWDNYWSSDQLAIEGKELDDLEYDATDSESGDNSSRVTDTTSILEAVFDKYTVLKKLLKENDHLWRRVKIARSTFGEQSSMDNDDLLAWISELKRCWKQLDKVAFVQYTILNCDETLLEICLQVLDTFDVKSLEWLIENYDRRIKNEKTVITDRFSNHKKLIKFVNKCCAFTSDRNLLSNSLFAALVQSYNNYMVIHILTQISDHPGNRNASSRNVRKKKKGNEIDVKQTIERLRSKGIKEIELELYNSRKRASEDPEPMLEGSPALDILKDLNSLKSKLKQIKRDDVKIADWEPVKNWEPKPFGCV